MWSETALVASREVIVCEALIDAMTFWCAGYRNVIAALGVNGFTPDHWAALKRHGTRSVWFAYDRDEAGNAAAEALGAELLEAGIKTWRVLFPKGTDANDYANTCDGHQHIASNQSTYDAGQQQLNAGMTDAEMRQQNLTNERIGKTAVAVTACAVSGGEACTLSSASFAGTVKGDHR